MSRSMKAGQGRGFLLLEVLVSITIISVGLIFVIRSFSTSSRAIETAAKFLKSVSLLEERLWDLEAEGAVDKGRDRDTFKKERAYRWEMVAEDAGDFPINEVNIKVIWEGPLRKQRVSLDTYMWNEED